MFLHQSKKLIIAALACLVATVSVFTISCQKELSSGNGFTITDTPPDLSSKISSSVSGFVTNESGAAAEGAMVQVGTATTTTDKYGYFEVKDAQVVKAAAVVTITKPGYFNSIKTYIAAEGKSAFFRVKLLPKTIAGNFDAAAGGTVTLTNGLAVSFPANAVVTASNGNAYTGTVNVAAQFINPTAADLASTMPGDLRGLDSLGFLKLLSSYGMAAVELTGGTGELLQIAGGKKATMTFPIPSGILSSAPNTIPLWSFNETNGLWKQEGNAVKSGSNYVGEVPHFSYWNCDIPLTSSVQFTLTVVDADGNPVPNVTVSVKYADGTYTGAHGITDESGFINGTIPANSQLTLEIYSSYNCNGAAVTQNISTTNQTLALGNVALPAVSTTTVSGTVTDCSNAPLGSGSVIMIKDGVNYHFPVSNGTFSFSSILCSNSVTASLIAVDNVNLEEGDPVSITLASGNVAAGALQACGTSIEEYINYTFDGDSYSLVPPADTVFQSPETGSVYIFGYAARNGNSGGQANDYANITFTNTGIAAGRTQTLTSFFSNHFTDSVSIAAPINVNITEYGTVSSGFISGNFSGTLTGASPANTPHPVTCQFRVKRNH